MSDDERRRFALENPTDADVTELNFEEPRDADQMGRGHQDAAAEFADPENRDGTAAQLDDERHDRNVRRAADRQKRDRTESD
jgi:hypothetical protein